MQIINIVLIDIFPRQENISNTSRLLIDTKNGGIETHTVVLWKTKDDEITLIDPTAEKFSKFLLTTVIENFNYTLVSGLQPDTKLYSNGKKSTGYAT